MMVILLGWLLPEPYYYVYLAVTGVTFITQIIFRYCLLTPLEFYFRRKAGQKVEGNPYYLTYYSYKMFPGWVTDAFVDRISLVFMALSILVAALRLSGNL